MSDLGVWLAQQCQEDRDLLLKYQPKRFAKRGKVDRYYRWMTDFGFIEAKLDLLGVQPLIEDYDLARISDVLLLPDQTETLKLIQGAIRKSAHVLERDKTQLVEHLWGRLLDCEMPGIQGMLEQAKQSKDSPWLRPLKANLESAGEGCLRTLTGHTESVNAVDIAPDGLTAISASWDNTLKIWDIKTGTELLTLTGHTDSVNAVAIAPDGLTAISASSDKTLKIWDLLTGEQVASFSGDAYFNCCAILPDGVSVVAGDLSGGVHFLRLEGMRDLGDAAELNNPVSLFYSGLVLAKQRQYEAALAKFTEVAEIRPDALIVWWEQGKVLYELERYAEAVASLDKAIELAEKDRNFWFCRGFALMKCGSQEAARETWDFAINIQPADWDFWFKKAKVLFESKRYERAICCLDLAIKIEPNESYFWWNRGITLEIFGRTEDAISSYDRALELQPDDPDILDNRAYALLTLGRYDDAMAGWDKVLEIDPNYAGAYYNKSRYFALQNQIELALENLRRAIQLEPERYRELAKTDAAFDGIRGDVRFQELLLG